MENNQCVLDRIVFRQKMRMCVVISVIYQLLELRTFQISLYDGSDKMGESICLKC